MKAYIYARQSSTDNEEYSESVEVQIIHCQKLAESMNIDVIGIERDINSSGKLYPTGYEELAKKDIIYQNWLKSASTRKTSRDGLGHMFQSLGDIDYIIVDDYTRLARPLTGSFLDAFITQMLFANGVKILTVKSGEIDLNSFNDSLITVIQNIINDNQIAIQRKKSKDGLKRLLDNGVNKQGIGRVLGFRSTGRKHEIEPIERELEVVKFIYKKFLEGVAINEIARFLNDEFPDVFCKTKVDRQIVRKTLIRPFYCGYIFDSNGQLIKSEQVYQYACISFEDWSKIQKIFEHRKIGIVRPKKVWLPCSGYVYCGKCGNRMISHHCGGRSPYYTCQWHLPTRREPCRGNLSVSNNNTGFALGLNEAISPLLIIGAIEKLKQYKLDNKIQEELEKSKIELNNLLLREKKITEMFLNGILDESNAENTLKDISNKKNTLKHDIIIKEAQIDSSTDEEADRKLFRRVVAGDITHGEWEDLFRKSIKKILIDPEKVVIQTILGDVAIPRKRVERYNLMPKFTIANEGKKEDEYKISIYYYYGKREMANIYSKTMKKIADFKNIKIYFEE